MKIRKKDGTWLNSQVFRPAAAHFEKHGCYTFAPEGTEEWLDFWTEELRRRKEGYEVGGEKITGDHYHYLNYTPIKKSDNGDKTAIKGKKRITFPDFWDYDYFYFWCLYIARYGISKKELAKLNLPVNPRELDGGKHFIVNKARRRGYSYKMASILANNYDTNPNTLSVVAAAEKKFLYPRGTMVMVKNALNFLNEHTAFKKKREVLDRQEHVKASFIKVKDGISTEAGYKSEIMAVSFNDNPDALRGADADIVAFDEAGVFDNLEFSYAATRPTVEDGALITGQIVVFGTSGEGSSAEYANFFYSPEQYNFLSFPNIWDENAEDQIVGFFHPVYQCMTPFIDEQGNSGIEKAMQSEMKARKTLSPAALRARQMEYPFSPSEAFLAASTNSFPIAELKKQLQKVKSDPMYMNRGVHGHLEYFEGKIRFVPDTRGLFTPVVSYETPPSDLTGCVVIYEQPEKEDTKGLYIIGYDPIFQDKSQERKPSLASIYVMKTYARFSYSAGSIVASYVGRPDEVDTAHKLCAMLSEYYGNAEIMHENMAKDAVNYFTNKKKLHLLAVQPDAVISAAIKNSKVSRRWGVHMATPLKDAGEKYVKAWLQEELQINEDGGTMLRLETIYDQGLLEELIKYNHKDNFDRVISLFLLMFIIKNDEEKFRQESRNSLKNNLEDLAKYVRSKYPRNASRQTQTNPSTEGSRQFPVVQGVY